MTPDRWRRIEELYHLAYECDPTARAAFLDQACAGDETLRREVESLLEQSASAQGFLTSPAVAATPFVEDLSGRQFGPYRVVAALGEGGMATVYKAYQPAVDRYVALKILSRRYTADPKFLHRFRHEARIVAQFQHPHILPVFDFGESDGYTFLAMPLVDGGTLAGLLKGRPVPLVVTERVIRQVCEALDYAHSKGVSHCDIKPTNILIDERGNCLVADFGIARIANDATRLTFAGALIGTPAYMSPEQAAGRDVGPQSDIYSLGIVLYEMLTGRVPFKAETPVAVALKHLSAPMPPPCRLNPALTPALEAVILRAVARSPDDRFPSGEKLAASLSAAVREAQQMVTAYGPVAAAASASDAAETRAATDTPEDFDNAAPALRSAPAAAEAVRRLNTVPPARTPGVGQIARLRSAWLAAGLLTLLIGGAVWFIRRGTEGSAPRANISVPDQASVPPSVAATGTLLIDALPWAEVAEILDAHGQTQRLAPQTYTPLAVSVPAGVYQVTFKDPSSSRTQAVTVVVPTGGTQHAFAEFGKIDVDAYFQKAGWPVTR